MKSYDVGDILTAKEFDELTEVVTSIGKKTKDKEAVAQIDEAFVLIDKKIKDLEYFRMRIREYADLKGKLKNIVKALPITDDVVDLSYGLNKKLH